MAISANKSGQYLIFVKDNKEIRYDLADGKFKRPLKDGTLKELAGVAEFFRKTDVMKVCELFQDEVWRNIIYRMIIGEGVRSNTNFATIFSAIEDYQHLESYLLLKIRIDSDSLPFANPEIGRAHV